MKRRGTERDVRHALSIGLRARRRELAMTQVTLAKKARLSVRWIQMIEAEQSNVSLDALAGIARALRIEIADLMLPVPASRRRPA